MPEDNNFRGLLSDYVAPVEDDGFSNALMAEIDAQENQAQSVKPALIRRLALYGAGFVGGIMAAVQLPKLISMMQGLETTVPDLPVGDLSTSAMAFNPALMMVAVLIGLVLWTALDQRAAELF